MLLLMAFAFVAGAGTGLSPCVLPLLPVLLSGGASGGARRPAGIAAGLAASFTLATVALAYAVDGLGLPGDVLRRVAIATLAGFGIVLASPWLSARVAAGLGRTRVRPLSPRGDGLGSGLVLGAGLGLVYAPCAGPILAAVVTVSASQPFTAGRLGVAFAYGLGTASVLYAVMLGGRRLTRRLARGTRWFEPAMGGVMIVAAIALTADLDLRFERAVAADVPGWLVTPTKALETTGVASRELERLRAPGSGALAAVGPPQGRPRDRLSDLGAAPELPTGARWFNTPGRRPLSLRALRGRVVLVDFWTYSCINCLRTLPYLKAWDARYRSDGLTIVGVHTPEFPFERSAANVSRAIAAERIRYPVVQDNDRAAWDAYGTAYWPADFFVDARGHVRYALAGEGDYAVKERVIRTLLAEAGRPGGGRPTRAHGVGPPSAGTTAEAYLGAARGERFASGRLRLGVRRFRTATPRPDGLALAGTWTILRPAAVAGRDARLSVSFRARRVYVVLGSPGRPRRIRIRLDGRPLDDRFAGPDVRDGWVPVRRHRLYRLVDLPTPGRHLLYLRVDRGIRGYAVTFG